MSKNKRKAPITLSGQRGNQSQNNGKSNHTLTKGFVILDWIYEQTIKGLTATAFDSFNQNGDTSFRTHVSELCHKYGLEIPRKRVKNPNTGSYFKKYWLSINDLEKVKKILNK